MLLSEYTAIWCRARRAAGFPDMGLRHEAGARVTHVRHVSDMQACVRHVRHVSDRQACGVLPCGPSHSSSPVGPSQGMCGMPLRVPLAACCNVWTSLGFVWEVHGDGPCLASHVLPLHLTVSPPHAMCPPSCPFSHPAGQQRCKWSMAGPSGPPGHDSDAAAARSLLTPHAPLLQLLRDEAEDTRWVGWGGWLGQLVWLFRLGRLVGWLGQLVGGWTAAPIEQESLVRSVGWYPQVVPAGWCALGCPGMNWGDWFERTMCKWWLCVRA